MVSGSDTALAARDGEGADRTDRPLLTIQGLSKSFAVTGSRTRRRAGAVGERVLAVDRVSLDVEPGEMFTLLGPSGCGKTTTLRSIAGLEQPDAGRIVVDGRALFDGATRLSVPTHDRRLGMVFQSYAIWPHMSVFRNAAFPLVAGPRRTRPPRAQIAEKVERVLELTGLAAFADRPATKLSGGQQQRLALARALVAGPRLLLLDEPLSNLDAKLRESMSLELKRMQRELGVTSIYVTHDQTEALELSSRIAVMDEGRVVQVARPREIYELPATRFVADFIGTTNFFDATVREIGSDQMVVDVDGGAHLAVHTQGTHRVGDAVVLSVRPESVELTEAVAGQPTRRGVMTGTVRARGFRGDSINHELAVGAAVVRSKSSPSRSYPPGTRVDLHLAPEKIVVLRADR